METVIYEQLLNIRRDNEDVVFINALPVGQFKKGHIPGSINVPHECADFPRLVEMLIGGRHQPVVFYCGGGDNPVAIRAIEKLETAGFSRIMLYAGGMREWIEKSMARGVANAA